MKTITDKKAIEAIKAERKKALENGDLLIDNVPPSELESLEPGQHPATFTGLWDERKNKVKKQDSEYVGRFARSLFGQFKVAHDKSVLIVNATIGEKDLDILQANKSYTILVSERNGYKGANVLTA